MAALTQNKVDMGRTCYEGLLEIAREDPDLPEPYLHKAHFSLPSVPLYFLVRVQPYSRHFLTLQGGRWDAKERMFTSVSETWRNCVENAMDNKECIPEMFTLPDLFTGARARDTDRVGEAISALDHLGPVELPPWAHGSAEKFVMLNRAALESEYVSAHLHEWVDLIFGFRSSPRHAALESDNLFHPYTYEESVSDMKSRLESRVSEAKRLAQIASDGASSMSTESADQLKQAEGELQALFGYVQNFGQGPPLLFEEPHVPRLPSSEAMALAPSPGLVSSGSFESIAGVSSAPVWLGVVGPSRSGQLLLAAFHDGTLLAGRLADEFASTLQFRVVCRGRCEVSPHAVSTSITEAGNSFCAVLSTCSRHTGSSDDDFVSIFHPDFWSHGLSIVDLDSTSPDVGRATTIFNAPVHGDSVTCVCSDEFGRIIATASADTTVRLWSNIEPVWFAQDAKNGSLKKEKQRVAGSKLGAGQQRSSLRRKMAGKGHRPPLSLMCHLIGHDGAVTCVDVCSRAGLVASGGVDGTVIIHTLAGVFVRSLSLPEAQHGPGSSVVISRVSVSPVGHVVAIFRAKECDVVCVFEDVLVSGECVATLSTQGSRITQTRLSRDGRVFIGGDNQGALRAWRLPGLEELPLGDSTSTSLESSGSLGRGLRLTDSPITALTVFTTQGGAGAAADAVMAAAQSGACFVVMLPTMLA
jgi:WD40 repeat protein